MKRLSHDGLSLVAEAMGAGNDALFLHANGFCKEMWRPVVAGLNGVRVVAADVRGHGDSAVGSAPFDWWDLGRDASTWAQQLGRPRVGVGHSSGATALAMSEITNPGTWDRLVLIEPIVFPPPYGRNPDHFLVQGALRRRRSFVDRDAATESYRGRGPFKLWTDAALELYVEYGFRDGPDGHRHLACLPETEAEIFAEGDNHRTWDRLPEVSCPVLLVVGSDSPTHPQSFAEELCNRLRVGRLEVVAGATHFLPMELPDVLRELIRAELELL